MLKRPKFHPWGLVYVKGKGWIPYWTFERMLEKAVGAEE